MLLVLWFITNNCVSLWDCRALKREDNRTLTDRVQRALQTQSQSHLSTTADPASFPRQHPLGPLDPAAVATAARLVFVIHGTGRFNTSCHNQPVMILNLGNGMSHGSEKVTERVWSEYIKMNACGSS